MSREKRSLAGLPLILAVVGGLAATPDTIVVLGAHSIDLTGDGELEVLEVRGVGESIDSLEITFSITSSGRILHSETMRPFTRTFGFDAGMRRMSTEEHRRRLSEFGAFFFAEEKFRTPEGFIAAWERKAPGHVEAIPEVVSRRAGVEPKRAAELWDEIRRRGITVFEYSPGGDASFAIAWSESEQSFLTLVECC
jgi:hypothetical protein